MAYSIVNAIQDKEIFLIEAGVGIGKSYVYLIPFIKSIQTSETFAGFVIATPTMIVL